MAFVTQTANFNYSYTDSLTESDKAAAISRANALAATCESDLTTLESWFGVSGGFGSSNRASIMINNIPSLGVNFGFQTDGNTQIISRPFTDASDGDAAARAVFAAEMSEVLMSYRNQQTGQTTWMAGNSMGEALSIVCTGLLHPEGYYTDTFGSPRIAQWLNSTPRPNWIDQNESTDRKFVSFGCGIVFIYYLLSQLGYSINDVITKAGTTLGETYSSLTGRSDGWSAFIRLLDEHISEGSPYGPRSDDLFPFPRLAKLEFSPNPVVSGTPSIGTVTLNSPYAAGRVVVRLNSEDTELATVPQLVHIEPTINSTDFQVATVPRDFPFRPIHVRIVATYGEGSLSATLTVRSPINVGILDRLTLSPNPVIGGNPCQGMVTLYEPVPTDTVVSLIAVEPGQLLPMDPSTVASVPSTVKIPAHRTTASFKIQTQALTPPTAKKTATVVAEAVDVKYALLTVES